MKMTPSNQNCNQQLAALTWWFGFQRADFVLNGLRRYEIANTTCKSRVDAMNVPSKLSHFDLMKLEC